MGSRNWGKSYQSQKGTAEIKGLPPIRKLENLLEWSDANTLNARKRSVFV